MIRKNRTLFVFLHDLAMAALAYGLSLYLRLGNFDFNSRGPWVEQWGLFVLVCAAVFGITRLHRGVWRYVSVRDLARIGKAVTFAIIAYLPISFLLTRLEGMPRSVPGILWFVLIGMLSGSRLIARMLKDRINLDGLLGRPEIALNRQAIAGLIKGKNVLITGAGGTIGAELSRQIARLAPARLTLIENSEFNLYSIELAVRELYPALDVSAVIANVREAGRITRLFEEYQPDLVFHAAALKHVPLAECNVREALLTNVIGTRNVADASAAAGADAMVLISTDKAVNPTSVMGASKRMAEHYCQSLDHENGGNTRFLTVRFGNVLGSTGSVVPRFREQLERGGPLTVTHPDITRYFMTVMEAVELVLQASAQGLASATRGRIMVLDMGEPIKIAELARKMVRLAGLRPDKDVKIIYTGLRPGEKLHEELFAQNEKLTPAGADGVLLAAAQPLPLKHVQSLLRDLAAQAQDAATSESALRLKMGYLVPEFAPPGADSVKKAAHG
ncbi:MAG: polysaccharide biosynthesis protein [Proteobacteria bacterium]|nr:polysaccharide biosynthesis protein [Pseudomonadota bacterium]